MIADLLTDQLPALVEADVCVIGAGAAGIVLACELAARNRRVVLLESGGRGHEAPVHALNDACVVGLPHHGIHDGRYRALGGSTTRWGGQMLPLQVADFEKRDWIEWSGWPIKHADLAHYYERATRFAGLANCLASDPEVWQRSGRPVPVLGDGIEPYLSRWCPQPNFAKLHGAEIVRSRRLQCILHATVTAFSMMAGGVVSAIARSLRQNSVAVRARHYVVCVGGIETPRLLLQPLADVRPAPWSDCRALGGFFQDHPICRVGTLSEGRRRALHRIFQNIYIDGLKYHPRFRLTQSRQRQQRLLGAAGFVEFAYPELEVFPRWRMALRDIGRGRLNRWTARHAAAGVIKAAPVAGRVLWRQLGATAQPRRIRLGIQLEQAPRPESRITLADETDAFGMRRARLDWRLGEIEISTIGAFADIVKAAFEGCGLAEVELDRDVAARSPEVLARVEDFAHHMGTARMAVGPATGVVDPDLRVFAADNLYVCGGAVFPTSGFSNPTHTLLALAFRLADHLDARLGHA